VADMTAFLLGTCLARQSRIAIPDLAQDAKWKNPNPEIRTNGKRTTLQNIIGASPLENLQFKSLSNFGISCFEFHLGSAS
jgi:hypothetical protein